MRRTAAINQVRGLLLERGITLRKGRHHVDAALPGILEDADAKLSGALRVLLAQLKLELDHLEIRIDQADAMIKKTASGLNAWLPQLTSPAHRNVAAVAFVRSIRGADPSPVDAKLMSRRDPKFRPVLRRSKADRGGSIFFENSGAISSK
jgi:hypothetical protein